MSTVTEIIEQIKEDVCDTRCVYQMLANGTIEGAEGAVSEDQLYEMCERCSVSLL